MLSRSSTKIYIKNYNPSQLTSKFSQLHDYFGGKEKNVEIVSPDGWFTIERNTLYKTEPVDKEYKTMVVAGFTLLIDPSTVKKDRVFSQIPFDHSYLEVAKFYFSSEKESFRKAFLALVVEGHYIEKTPGEKGLTMYENFVPTDLYFLTKESTDNILLIKELNVFLSILK
jgi:hypothetical protein